MLMQLKPGRQGSDSEVHSLMSAEVTQVTGGLAHTGRWPVWGSRPALDRPAGSHSPCPGS